MPNLLFEWILTIYIEGNDNINQPEDPAVISQTITEKTLLILKERRGGLDIGLGPRSPLTSIISSIIFG